MNTDRELLEAAAKAAGIEVVRSRMDDPGRNDLVVYDSARNPHEKCGAWNPLTDDGDALRLAVEIGFSIITEPYYVRIHSIKDAFLVRQEVVCDGYAATRRAIVRAAAAIGAAK